MKVLLVGSGGREHALAWKLAQSSGLTKLYIAPGNPGTAKLGENVHIAADDIDGLVRFAREKKVGLVVVGPEDPLAGGLVDRLEDAGIKAFGPRAGAAAIEADKSFAKEIMRSGAIPTAESRVFSDYEDARCYIASRDSAVVVKASGLAKGKGVYVCDDPVDGILAAEKIMQERLFGQAGAKIIVEEKLLGQEASILAFVDGNNIYVMESAQDHKPVGDGDTGDNTGGMGAYSPAPIITDKLMSQIEREVLVPVVDSLRRNGTEYKGVLYAGLMLTAAGPKVLEFNARFGDPETQPIMMRFKGDLLQVMLAVCDGELGKVSIGWDPRPAVCVVMSSAGYPGSYEKGKPISGIKKAEQLADVKVFQAGTAIKDGELCTNGGRVLGVTAMGDNLAVAKQRAYEAVKLIEFEGAYYRNDIADKGINN